MRSSKPSNGVWPNSLINSASSPMSRIRPLALTLGACLEPVANVFPAVAAWLVDKCRAELLGQLGEYHYNYPLDRKFSETAALESGRLQESIAIGVDDQQVATWMIAHAGVSRDKFLRWSHGLRAIPLWQLLIFDDW